MLLRYPQSCNAPSLLVLPLPRGQGQAWPILTPLLCQDPEVSPQMLPLPIATPTLGPSHWIRRNEPLCFFNLIVQLLVGAQLYQFLSCVIFITLVYLWAPSSGRYFSGLVNKT